MGLVVVACMYDVPTGYDASVERRIKQVGKLRKASKNIQKSRGTAKPPSLEPVRVEEDVKSKTHYFSPTTFTPSRSPSIYIPGAFSRFPPSILRWQTQQQSYLRSIDGPC